MKWVMLNTDDGFTPFHLAIVNYLSYTHIADVVFDCMHTLGVLGLLNFPPPPPSHPFSLTIIKILHHLIITEKDTHICVILMGTHILIQTHTHTRLWPSTLLLWYRVRVRQNIGDSTVWNTMSRGGEIQVRSKDRTRRPGFESHGSQRT